MSGALLISMSSVKFQGHTAKNRRSRPKLGVSGLYLQFEFTDGYEIMHKDWSSIEEMPYCFCRLSFKFQGHMTKKNIDFDWPEIGIFRTVTPVRIHRWLWNAAEILKWHRRGALFIFKVFREISRWQWKNIADFERNWAFPDSHSSLNSLMALKWCTKLDVV